MCGVGGIYFKTADHGAKTGEIAYRILNGIFRRGPDSTGVALWHANEDDLLYVGINYETPSAGATIIEVLDRLGTVQPATDGEGCTALHRAAEVGDAELVALLLTKAGAAAVDVQDLSLIHI